jgi:type IV secretory pathway TrbL component
MLVIAWILLYFSIGIGLTTIWQVTTATRVNQDESIIVLAVVFWPMVLTCVGIYHLVRYLTRYFEAKRSN